MFQSELYKIRRGHIGNILIYIAQNVPEKDNVSLTKSLKLLYLIDEYSVKTNGAPITWLDHHAWQRGPVAEDVYFEVKRLEEKKVEDKNLSLDEFISVSEKEYKGSKYTSISSKDKFEKDIFSPYEMSVINEVMKKYGHWSAEALEDETHKSGSLYDQVVKANNLDLSFSIKGNSHFPLEFINLIKDDPINLMTYTNAYESIAFSAYFLDK